MKILDNNLKRIAVVVFICTVAAIGTATLSGSFASPFQKPNIDLRVENLQKYDVDTTTQLQRISVTIRVVNNGVNVLQISPGLQMQLIDDTGQSHPMTAIYQSAGEIIGGPLAPGAVWSDPIDFNLSAGQTPKKLIFQSDDKTAPIEIGL